MFMQSQKFAKWGKGDYFLSILQFLIHFVLLIAIVVGFIFINCESLDKFKEYFVNTANRQSFVCLGLSILFIVSMIYLYFFFEFRDFLIRPKNIAVVFIVMEFSLIICLITGKYVSIYARPFALGTLLMLLLVNKSTARYFNFTFSLLLFVVDVFANQVFSSFIPVFLTLIIGSATNLVAIYLVDEIGSRIKVFSRGFIIAIPIIFSTVAVELYTGTEFAKLMPTVLYSLMSGVTSVVYMMAIIPVFEWLFNILTNYRLVEITDHKSKLIQKMKDEAPGTFNHCLMVASLAESCASAIGDNALLARAAAYYHDIGKLKQPMYFTENQHGVNPHDDLTPELSTQIIRAHTTDGYDLIRKYHLPLILADVAREHHGTLPIQYFYMKAQKFTDGELDIDDFCYQGPKPRTKIAAIIMLADACEAAVRAQNDRSPDKVEMVVRRIIEDRINNDQFSDCEITMRDIDNIRKTIEDNLSGVYHDRINYPKLKIGHQATFESNENGGENKSDSPKNN